MRDAQARASSVVALFVEKPRFNVDTSDKRAAKDTRQNNP